MNNLTEEQIEHYLNNTSFSGLKALYICYCAFQTTRKFELAQLEKYLSTRFKKEYTYGWIAHSYSIGLIDADQEKGEFSITAMDKNLEEKIEPFIKRIAARMDSMDKIDDESLSVSRRKAVKEIEGFFNYHPKL